MKATDWDFTNRALAFGLVFSCATPAKALAQTFVQ